MGKYALIIGIEKYSADSDLMKVKYAKNDAVEMAHYAQSAGFKLIGDSPIVDKEATYSQIIKWLDLLFHYVLPDDFVLLYYAGHGYYTDYGGYLIPYDYNSNNEKNESTCISFDNVSMRLKSKNPAKFVFFLDTCHSGFAGKLIDIRGRHSLEYKPASQKARDKIKAQTQNMINVGKCEHFIGRVVFTSSGPHEPSMGIDEFKHGLFTYCLLQCLRSKSYQNEINILGLISLTEDMVISYSIEHRLKQTPVSYSNIQGNFFIPTYKTAHNDESVLAVLGSTKKKELSEDYHPSDISLPKAELDRFEDSRKIPPSEPAIESKKAKGQVFISYSHRDKKFVKRLYSDLENAGVSVWLDEKKIKVGDSISAKIEDGISKCDFFCLVISMHSFKSNWVKREYRTALNMQLSPDKIPKILPLLIQDVELPLFLKDIKYADFSLDYDSGFMELLNSVKSDMPQSPVAVTELTDEPPLVEITDQISPIVQLEEKMQDEIDVKEADIISSEIVGINYKVLCFGANKIPGLPKLKYSEKDAYTVAKYFELLKNKADVTLLTGKNATKKNIIAWIQKCNSFPGELNVILFFAGHSSAKINENKKYLERCLWIDSNDHIAPADHMLKTSEVLMLLNNPNHKLIFIIDACYSFEPRMGVSIKEIFRQFKDTERMSFLKDYVIISAAALNQLTIEDPQIGHGVLTYHFLKTISGKYTLSLKKKISCFKLLEILDKKVRTHRFLTDTGRKIPLKILMENGIMVHYSFKSNFHIPILKPSFLDRFPFAKKS